MKTEVKCNRLPGLLQYNWILLVILIVMLPSIYWIGSDHHIWPWDQAWYGEVSVDLWFKLTQRFSEWWPAMVAAFNIKAPGVAWIGQFFTPLGQAMGSIEAGLLCSLIATQIGTLLFAWKIADEIAPKKGLVACASVLIFASAPLFVAMSHQYVTEPLQLFGVTYFYFLATRGYRMPRVLLLGNLMIAASIALLAKATSPIYCVLPGLIATCALFQKRDAKNKASGMEVFWEWFCLSSGLALCALCGKWYAVNIEGVREQVKLAMSLEVTVHYGRAGTFFQKLPIWFAALQCSFGMPWVIIGVLILCGVGIAASRIRARGIVQPCDAGRAPLNLLAIASVIHILWVISLCAMNYNEENRYLLPLLPAVAIIYLWFIAKIRFPWLLAGIVALFSYQWVVVCVQALGFSHADPRISYWVIPFDRNRTMARELARIVHRTSNANTNLRYSIVGMELPWLNANSFSFFAAKQELKSGVRCYCTSLSYGAKEMDLEWKRFNEIKPEYFISLEESVQPPPNFLNELSIPVLKRIRDDADFIQEPYASKFGVVLFRRNHQKTEATTPGSPVQ